MKRVSKDYIKNKIKKDQGYKIFYNNWYSLFGKYNNPVGCVYIEEEPIEICQKGLHYCHTIQDCLSHILPKKDIHICEVEAYDHVIQDGNKCCTTTLYIKNEINLKELKDVNYKSDNSEKCSLNAYILYCNHVNLSHMIRFSQHVYNSYDILFSTLINNSDHIAHSRGIVNSKNINYCFQIGYSHNLNNCTNMLFCKDLQYKNDYFFNKPSPYNLNELFNMPLKELCKLLPTLSNYDPKLFFKLFPFTCIKLNSGKIIYLGSYSGFYRDIYWNDNKNVIDEYFVKDEWLKFIK